MPPPRAASLALFLLLLPGTAAAVPASVEVVGLFRDRAVLRIGGEVRTLREGQISPEGVRLVRADSRRAVLEIDGRRTSLGLSNRVSTRFSAPAKRVVTVPRDASGHYRVSGLVNGRRAEFLVDTGATVVTLSSAHARRLGIEWRRSERRGRFNTAMGQTEARFVRLDSLQVGAIRQDDVEAVVIEGDHPQMILLGMSFLGTLELTDSGGVLRLSQ